MIFIVMCFKPPPPPQIQISLSQLYKNLLFILKMHSFVVFLFKKPFVLYQVPLKFINITKKLHKLFCTFVLKSKLTKGIPHSSSKNWVMSPFCFQFTKNIICIFHTVVYIGLSYKLKIFILIFQNMFTWSKLDHMFGL